LAWFAGGIIENTIEAMQSGATWAWLGAAISQPCFEVGIEVKKTFCEKYPELDMLLNKANRMISFMRIFMPLRVISWSNME
jgi:copper oxidase (laccase) domain-containing protein